MFMRSVIISVEECNKEKIWEHLLIKVWNNLNLGGNIKSVEEQEGNIKSVEEHKGGANKNVLCCENKHTKNKFASYSLGGGKVIFCGGWAQTYRMHNWDHEHCHLDDFKKFYGFPFCSTLVENMSLSFHRDRIPQEECRMEWKEMFCLEYQRKEIQLCKEKNEMLMTLLKVINKL